MSLPSWCLYRLEWLLAFHNTIVRSTVALQFISRTNSNHYRFLLRLVDVDKDHIATIRGITTIRGLSERKFDYTAYTTEYATA
jgi:hypothetical protein